MQLKPEQKEALKKLITKDAYGFLSDIQDAQIDFKATAQHAKKTFGIEVKKFNKLAKTYFENSLDDQKAELEFFEKEYKELLDE